MARKRILTEIDLTKIAAVDLPCQEHAEAKIVKRKWTAQQRRDAADAGHALPDGSFPIETTADLENAIHDYGRAKDQAKAKAHIISRAKALGATDSLPEGWNVKKSGQPGVTDEGDDMSAIKKSLGLADSATEKEVEDTIAKMVADNEELTKAKTAAEDKAARLEAEAEALTKAKKEASEDESFTNIDGAIMKKSVLGGSYEMMKSMNDRLENAELAKRATDEFGALPGKPEDIVPLLKMAKRAPKEEREKLEALMKAHNELLAKGTKKMGTNDGDDPDAEDDADAMLDKKAKEMAEKDGISKDAAMAKVLNTAEGRKLYARTQGIDA